MLNELSREAKTVQHTRQRLRVIRREMENIQELERKYERYCADLENLLVVPSLGRSKVDVVMENIRTHGFILERKIRVLMPQVQSLCPATADELIQQEAFRKSIEKTAKIGAVFEQTLNEIFQRLSASSTRVQEIHQRLEEKTRMGFRH